MCILGIVKNITHDFRIDYTSSRDSESIKNSYPIIFKNVIKFALMGGMDMIV